MKLIALLILSCGVLTATAQYREDQFFIFDKDWKPIDIKQGVYFLRVRQVSDSDFEWTFYNMFGPRIRQENYSDATAKIKNGVYSYYFDNGKIDSSGNYESGAMHGTWYFKNREGQLLEQKQYDHGLMVKDTVFKQEDKKDTKDLPGEVESEYPGGLKAWAKYLKKNLNYPDRALNASVKGEARIFFIVDEMGNVLKPEISQSVEYSIDEEAIRIIKESKQWIPASKNGKPVKSYKMQPIIFSF